MDVQQVLLAVCCALLALTVHQVTAKTKKKQKKLEIITEVRASSPVCALGRPVITAASIVSRATPTSKESGSGQIPISVSCLTRQEILGVLIELQLCSGGLHKPYLLHTLPIMFAPT